MPLSIVAHGLRDAEVCDASGRRCPLFELAGEWPPGLLSTRDLSRVYTAAAA